MKMKKTIGAIAFTAFFASMGASAVEKNITVTASVDPTIDLLQADGKALPNAISLTYSPAAKGFEPYTLPTAVHTNDDTKGVVVKLSTDPKLTNILQPNTQIPMSVTLGGKTLTTAAQTFTADEMNVGATGMSSISSVKDLVIQAQQQATAAGNYQGVVSIILTQAP